MGHYLVTGSAGFVASKVAETLLTQGHTVAGVDNLNDAYDVSLKYWRLARLGERPGFSFDRLDICDRSALQRLFGRRSGASARPFDAVVHLAARAGVRQSVQDPWSYVDTNVTGTLNLLEMCRQRDVPKLVFASSSSVYGRDNSLPYQEDMNTDRPLSPYAASKKAAETYCHAYHRLYGLDVTVFRYFTVYGPAGRPDMSLFRFVQWISEGRPVEVYGDGRQTRDFTYVDDIARGTILGLRELGYAVINLGSDHPVALCDAIDMIEEMVGRPAVLRLLPPQTADVAATWADIGRSRQLLGWEPQFELRRGLEEMVAWYQTNRDWAREVVTI